MLAIYKTFVLGAILAIAATGCAAGSGAASPDAPDGNLVLRASGSGSWSVDCDATTRRGSAKSDIQGRAAADFDLIVLRDVRTATCTYDAGNAALTLNLTDEGLGCPFGAFEDEICRTVIAAGSSGTFEFSPE